MRHLHPSSPVSILALLGALLAACSSDGAKTTEPADAAADGAPADAAALTGSCPTRLPTHGSACDAPAILTCDYPYCDQGGPGSAVCANGQWQTTQSKGAQCREREDAGATGSPFACGAMTCGATQYCATTVGGACIPTDAGCQASQSTSCADLPANCAACSCLGSVGCGDCAERDGHVFVTCYAP